MPTTVPVIESINTAALIAEDKAAVGAAGFNSVPFRVTGIEPQEMGLVAAHADPGIALIPCDRHGRRGVGPRR